MLTRATSFKQMTDPSTSLTSTPPQKGVKQGLPATGLAAAEDAAGKLWAVARLGTASPEAFARQFGEKAKASGGTWNTRVAVLRGFKLIRFEEKQIGLSELGQQLVNTSDPAGQATARRQALMNLKAYRELVDAFNGTAIPDHGVLATKLQFEYGKKEDFAQRAAQALLDSLSHAQMLDGGIVRKDGVSSGVSSTSTAPLPGTDEQTPADDDETRAAEIDRAFSDDDADPGAPPADEIEPSLPATTLAKPNKSLAVTLDLSGFRADEVLEILAALGFSRGG
jgi:hypothetical protein